MWVSQKTENHSFDRIHLRNVFIQLRNTVVLSKIKYIAGVSSLDSVLATTRVKNHTTVGLTQATDNTYHSSAVMRLRCF